MTFWFLHNWQRGAGKSSPHACLEENTTWDLVEDVEKIRKHLGIEEWIVLPFSISLCFYLFIELSLIPYTRKGQLVFLLIQGPR